MIVVATLIPALAVAAGNVGEYRDDFGDVSYAGSDGNLSWVAKWVESGESDGPAEGSIHIGQEDCANNKCLHIEGDGLIPSLAISRKADLSRFTSASLSYELMLDSELASTGTFTVEARGGGSGWAQLESYLVLTEGGVHSDSFDVSKYLGADFEIRFRLSGLIGGDVVTVDRVVIEGPLETPTSTTSSTTTTTVKPTTTTTRHTTSTISTTPTTTTPRPTTTSTSPSETTTTILSGAVPPSSTSSSTSTTSTTSPDSITASRVGGGPGGSATNRSDVGGLRAPGVGLLADYSEGMMGEMMMDDVEVLGVDLPAEFSMAVEVFELAPIWIAVLALLVAAAGIAGVDRRRRSDPVGL